MALTLLDSVNDVLKRVGQIQGTAEELTSFTSSDRQHRIDYVLQLFQLAVDDVLLEAPMPGGIDQGTITLVQGTETYSPASDFLKFVRGDQGEILAMRDSTNNRYLYHFPTGLQGMRDYKAIASSTQGQPFYFVLNESRQIELERPPDSDSAGQAFKYPYYKDVSVAIETDTFPFPDAAVRALEVAVAEIYRSEKKDLNVPQLQLMMAPAVARAIRIIRG